MQIKEENGIYSITNRVIAEVVNKEDEYIKKVITDYARKISAEYDEEIQVVFIDEDIAREIIDLGVAEYMRRKEGVKDER